MKHCPNPECPSLADHGIVSEYKDTALGCAECGKALAFGPAPSPDDVLGRPVPRPEAELVSLVVVQEETPLILVEQTLEQAGITCMVKGSGIQDVFSLGKGVRVNPITDPVEVFVLESDEEEARALLEALFE